MVPKDEGGKTSYNFHEIEWGFGFVEGNAWHHRYCPYLCPCCHTLLLAVKVEALRD